MFRSSLSLLVGLLCMGCQPLPDISVTLGPETPTTSEHLVVSLEVLGQEATSDELRPSFAYAYTWYRNGESVEGQTSDYLSPDVTLREDSWEVEVTPVWGNRQGASVRSNAVTILNGSPSIRSLVIEPELPGSHVDVMVLIDAEDPDGDTPSFEYIWEKNGDSIPELNDATLPAGMTTMDDQWTVRVRPVDGFDATLKGDEASISFEVGNGAPTITSIQIRVEGDPSKTVFQAGDVLLADAEVTDAEGDSVSVDYFWLVNNVIQNVSSMDRLSANYIRKGDTVQVQAVANDGTLTGKTFISESVVIANTPPSVQLAQVNPDVLKEGVVAQCVALGFQDVDGDTPQNRYEWFVSGVPLSVTTESLTSDYFDKNQTVQCCIDPFDGDGSGEKKCSSERVVQNSAPVLPTVVLQPSVPTKADVLSVDVSSATDADGDSVTAEIVWYLDGSPLSTAQTLNLSDVNFEKGQEIRAVVRPFDGTVSGTSTTTSTVVIQNSLPTISSVTFDPVMVFTDDTVAAQVDVVDLDGDAITLSYQWSIGSSIVGTSDSLDGTLHFKKGDVVQLMVTPSDGASGTSFTAPGITIQNSPPTGHTVSITPDKPMAGVTPLVCAVDTNATDADGDSIQYSVSWTQNTTTFTGATTTTLTNDTVGASDLDGDDVWQCSVTPSDGTDTGIKAIHSVVIAHPWEQISAGAQHSCGVDTTGQVVCWGDSSDGQTSPPSRVFDTIDAGGFHNCGVSAGNVYCWGRDTDKQVSDAPTAGSYAEVALGVKHSCSRNSSGNLECWGRDLSGCTTPPSGSFTSFTVGEYHGCALDSSGYASCWGRDVDDEASPPTTTKFSQLSAGASHTCGILQATGGLNCWGDNANGVVSTAPAATGYQRLACGKVHCCAINASDGIDCWGDDSAGQATPPSTTGWTDIDSGRYHTCAWDALGQAKCWGQNSQNQTSIP